MKIQWCLVQDKCCMYVCHCSYFITIATTTTVTFTGTKLLTFLSQLSYSNTVRCKHPYFTYEETLLRRLKSPVQG